MAAAAALSANSTLQHASSLARLADALRDTSKTAPHISTREFVACCDMILPFFDELGPVFHVARGEFQQKLDTLKHQVNAGVSQLADVVAADRAANRTTQKNSATRNLHRLAAAILFVKLLFERLMGSGVVHGGGSGGGGGGGGSESSSGGDAAAAGRAAGAAAAGAAAQHQHQQHHHAAAGEAGAAQEAAAIAVVSLREAASAAYETALAPFHTAIVRGVVRAGLLTLPSREHFIHAIGESEASAAARARDVVLACEQVHAAVDALFAGIEMPASSVWMWPSSR